MTLPTIRRFLLGAPLHSGAAPHQRLTKLIALPVFSSDALSSVAYATQEAMIALVLAGVGSAYLHLTLPISISIVILLVILTISYNQTIFAYPSGGGAYIVARDNLGALASQIAAVALLTDYILTVAVSVSSGIDAILSEYPQMDHLSVRLALNVAATLFIMLMNLRGVRESGAIFALPTYAFILSMLTLIGLGGWQVATGGFHHLALTPHKEFAAIHTLGIWVVLQAFASGCTALTGVEAISNGIPAFRPPESRNAAITMRIMAALLGTMFIGTSYLAQRLAALHHLVPSDSGETLISQIGHAVVGNSPFHAILQWATFLILILAANTSFADFPRLCAIAARDRRLPRWFSAVGDRLVFHYGIMVLAFLAIILQVVFKGSTDALIPLYAIGVFVAFTLSQAGMVVRWNRLRSPGWHGRLAMNGLGAILTAIVAVVFAVVKFQKGAWVVLVLIPVMVWLLTRVDRHYSFLRERLRIGDYAPPEAGPSLALVLLGQWEESNVAALEYARLAFPQVRALHWSSDSGRGTDLSLHLQRAMPDVHLVTDHRVSGGWLAAMQDEVAQLRREDPDRICTIILPGRLHGHPDSLAEKVTSWLLKWKLLHEPGVAVADTSTLRLPESCRFLLPGPGEKALPFPADREESVSSDGKSADGAGPNGSGPNGSVSNGLAVGEIDLSTALVARPTRSCFDSQRHRVLLLTPGMHRGILGALQYARQLSRNLRGLHIEMEPEYTEELRERWEKYAPDLALIIMESPYRQLREPLVRYVSTTRLQEQTQVLTVIVPEFVARKWWNKVLHNQSGLLLKFALRGQPNVVTVNTRYFTD